MPTRKFPRPKFPPLIVTPWAWPSELPEIRSVIYRTGPNAPPAEDKRQKAVNLMEAWKLRGRLPHAMDATCLLLNAILNGQNSGVTPLSARSVYAVAWARFVTGFCDIGKNAAISKSMFKVAHEIGMPEYFVELRHDIAHQGLPSMQRLAQAAEEGMAWLWTHFWVDLETKGVIPQPQTQSECSWGSSDTTMEDYSP
ncbi:hypothetical protein FH972_022815 [Carpinus fangiana]|uniref:Uncharacterized protein n=1 Tax=Carpinus fangiana TaxID=176857 RepID=A0A5N6KTU5_9ROSI|nr:hypothetical protein FH972_022815 [Carpinus fangiana]